MLDPRYRGVVPNKRQRLAVGCAPFAIGHVVAQQRPFRVEWRLPRAGERSCNGERGGLLVVAFQGQGIAIVSASGVDAHAAVFTRPLAPRDAFAADLFVHLVAPAVGSSHIGERCPIGNRWLVGGYGTCRHGRG